MTTSKTEIFTDLQIEHDGDALIIRFLRPEVRNAIRSHTWRELESALDIAESDPSVRVAVITGGPEFFCAGADLQENASADPQILADQFYMTMRLRQAQRFLDRLRLFPKPSVAAVEGFAIGLGWCIALSCDMIVASETTYFAQPAAAAGMLMDGGLLRQLIEALGVRRTTEIMLTRTTLSSSEAYGYGMVNRLTETGKALEGAGELVVEISRRPASVHFVNKALLASALNGDRESFYEHESTAVALNRIQPANVLGRQQFLAGKRFYSDSST